MASNGTAVRSAQNQRTVAAVGLKKSNELDEILNDIFQDTEAAESSVRERTLANTWGTREREFSSPQGCLSTQDDGGQTVLTWQTSQEGPRKCVTVSKETVKRPGTGRQDAFPPVRFTDERSLLDVVDGRRFPGPPSYQESRTLQTHTETKTRERMLSPVFRKPVNGDRPRVPPAPPHRRRVISPEMVTTDGGGTVHLSHSDIPSQGFPSSSAAPQKRSTVSIHRNYASEGEEALTWLEEQRRKLELKRATGRIVNYHRQQQHDRSKSSTDFTRRGPGVPQSDTDDFVNPPKSAIHLKNSLSEDSLNRTQGKTRAGYSRTLEPPHFTKDYGGNFSRFKPVESRRRWDDDNRGRDDRFYDVSSIQRPSSATPHTKYSFTMPGPSSSQYDEFGRWARPAGLSAPTSPVIPARGISSRDAVVRSKGKASEWFAVRENAMTYDRLDDGDQTLRKGTGVHLTAPLKPVPTEAERISLLPIGRGVQDLEPGGSVDGGTLDFRRSTPTLNRTNQGGHASALRDRSSVFAPIQRPLASLTPAPPSGDSTTYQAERRIYSETVRGSLPGSGQLGYDVQQHGHVLSNAGQQQQATNRQLVTQQWLQQQQQPLSQQQQQFSQQEVQYRQQIQQQHQLQQQQEQQLLLQEQQRQLQLQQEQQRQLQLQQEQQRQFQLQEEQRLLQLQQEQQRQLQLQEQQRQLQLQEEQRQLQLKLEQQRQLQLQEEQRLLQLQQEQQRQLQIQEQKRQLQIQEQQRQLQIQEEQRLLQLQQEQQRQLQIQEQQRQLQLQEQQRQLQLQEQQRQLQLQEEQRLLHLQQEQQRQLQLQEQQRQLQLQEEQRLLQLQQEQQRQLQLQQEQQRQLQLQEEQRLLQLQQEQQRQLQIQEQQRQLQLQEQQKQLQLQEQQKLLQLQQEQQKQLQLQQEQQRQFQLKQDQQRQLQLQQDQQRQLQQQQQQFHSQTIQRMYVVEQKTESRHQPIASQTLDSRVGETSFSSSTQPLSQFTFRETSSFVEPHRSTISDAASVQVNSSTNQFTSEQRSAQLQGGGDDQTIEVSQAIGGQTSAAGQVGGIQVGVTQVGGNQVALNQVGGNQVVGQAGLNQTGGQVIEQRYVVERQVIGRGQAGGQASSINQAVGQGGINQVGVQQQPTGGQVIEQRYIVEREVIGRGQGGQQRSTNLSVGQGDLHANQTGGQMTHAVGTGQGGYQAAYQGGTQTGTLQASHQQGNTYKTVEKNSWVQSTGTQEAGTGLREQQGVRFGGSDVESKVLPGPGGFSERVEVMSAVRGGQQQHQQQQQQQHQQQQQQQHQQQSYGYEFQQTGEQGSDGSSVWTMQRGGTNDGRSISAAASHQGIGSINPGGSWTLRPDVPRSGGHQRNASGSYVNAPRFSLSGARTASDTCITDGAVWSHQPPRFLRDTSKFWHKPNISRDDAIGLLLDKEPGSFVVRSSSTFPGSFGLALKVSQVPPNMQTKGGDPQIDLIRHFLIEPTPKGVRLKGCSNEPVFASLAALIYQHSVTPLSLPCKLKLPDEDIDAIDASASLSGPDSQLNGAACTVLYMGSVETENLTGPEALARSIKELFESGRPLPRSTIVQFKVTRDGITLTDNRRRIFFRRFYPIQTITFCGADPRDRRWTVKSEDITISGKAFGFVARKPGVARENACHVFLELDPTQPANVIVNFVTKVIIGQGQRLLQ